MHRKYFSGGGVVIEQGETAQIFIIETGKLEALVDGDVVNTCDGTARGRSVNLH
jgi:hypothetical protein